MKITVEQRKKVKGEGFLQNSDGVHFSARIITENGVLTSKQVKNLCEAAEKFGSGQVSFTSRLTVELPGIKFGDIENVKEYVAKAGLTIGGTGSKVRPIVACKGTVCTNGLFDTQHLGKEIHKRFYEGYRQFTLPHKFKIAVGGCPNNCVKPDLNDLGLVGQLVPNYDVNKCKGCRKCSIVETCPMKAASLENGKLTINKSVCSNCGTCVGKCPFNSIPDGKMGYKVYIGGRWGKKTRIGSPLNKLFTEEEALDVIEKAILLFKYKGKTGERFAETIDRLGLEQVEEALISEELMNKKDEILGIKTPGGASC